MNRPPSLRPTAEELLEAAREHLTSKVIPTITDARLRFQTLVAAHVIGVVSRELAAGDAPYAALAAQRVALPGAPPDDATLCAHIDAGDFDADDSGVQLRAHLRARAEHALMAWNPFYLARVMNDDTP